MSPLETIVPLAYVFSGCHLLKGSDTPPTFVIISVEELKAV